MNNYLAHHGIEGQKWGVTNGPPYPLGQEVCKTLGDGTNYGLTQKALMEGRIIPKGTETYRVATSDEKIDNKRKYVTTEEDEDQTYDNPYKRHAWDYDIGYTQEEASSKGVSYFTYETTKDLKVAGVNELLALYSDMKLKDLSDYNTSLINDPKNNDKKILLKDMVNPETKVSDLINDKNYDISEEHYRQTANTKTTELFGKEVLYKNGDKTFDALKKKGYDAVLDMEDILVTRSAAIILDPTTSLGMKEIKTLIEPDKKK